MEKVEHKYIQVNGSKLHVAELGSGSTAILFLHGFPEIWYTWRYQMTCVAEAGYRAIAIDFRGYGLSDPKAEPEKTTYADILSDLLVLLDALCLDKVVSIAKDFGARLEIIKVDGFLDELKLILVGFVRKIYILFSKSELPIAAENQEIMDMVEPSTPLPPWFTEKDLDIYGSLYERSGFRTALKFPYRSLLEEFNISNPKIDVPAMLIMGEKDYSLKFPGTEEYIRSGKVKHFAPNYEITFLPEGTHFVHEQLPDQVNQLILTFLGTQHESMSRLLSELFKDIVLLCHGG
ncbi:Alpha/Beta hydrolase fold containing protein [Heracleum sosnowskyi]|uniref:Alpha/Beta hydrolase fold containing protein n=1 Tax=Heracleum sosnowskyi TaxID=360622 RepID=A0AAD8HC87_9APIA|nr:Alpha/Beta hydrolase fold containing protein [Heracleum sosnowskyi]